MVNPILKWINNAQQFGIVEERKKKKTLAHLLTVYTHWGVGNV